MSLWYDSTWKGTQVSQAIGEHSNQYIYVCVCVCMCVCAYIFLSVYLSIKIKRFVARDTNLLTQMDTNEEGKNTGRHIYIYIYIYISLFLSIHCNMFVSPVLTQFVSSRLHLDLAQVLTGCWLIDNPLFLIKHLDTQKRITNHRIFGWKKYRQYMTFNMYHIHN